MKANNKRKNTFKHLNKPCIKLAPVYKIKTLTLTIEFKFNFMENNKILSNTFWTYKLCQKPN